MVVWFRGVDERLMPKDQCAQVTANQNQDPTPVTQGPALVLPPLPMTVPGTRNISRAQSMK